jgi:spore coat protein A
VIHLHGSPTHPSSDGWSDDAFFPGQSVVYHYPRQEQAALLWYHDHANMITRLNVYAGLAGMYIVRHPREDELNLPWGEHELPLLIQDRNFEKSGDDYTGRMLYTHLGNTNTFTGDFYLINGVVSPFRDVDPTIYRLRILNGCNGRTLRLALRTSDDPLAEADFQQIGVDCGFLARPFPIAADSWLQLTPAQRADVLVNFGPYAGLTVQLWDVSHIDEEFSVPFAEFRVRQAAPAGAIQLPEPLSGAKPLDPQHARNRWIVLSRDGQMHAINGLKFHDGVEETPELDGVEIWNILNLFIEDHPLHVHQVHFAVLDRRPVSEPNPRLTFPELRAWLNPPEGPESELPPRTSYSGDAQPAALNERGPLDTVLCPANMVTRIIMRFGPYTGRYMYHCHILEHEDMEMMRPFVVLPKAAAPHHDHHGHHEVA